MFRKYATDEKIAEKESNITRFANMTPSHDAKKMVTKIIRYGDLFEEYALNETFIDDLDASIRHSMGAH